MQAIFAIGEIHMLLNIIFAIVGYGCMAHPTKEIPYALIGYSVTTSNANSNMHYCTFM